MRTTHKPRPPQVKSRLGGRVKLVVSGGAPLAPHVEEFLRVAMCAPVSQVRRDLDRDLDRPPTLTAIPGRRAGGKGGAVATAAGRPAAAPATRAPRAPLPPPRPPRRAHKPHPLPPSPSPPPLATAKGYGLTECCAGATIASADDFDQFATNGPPLPCIEIRFESVPGGEGPAPACFGLASRVWGLGRGIPSPRHAPRERAAARGPSAHVPPPPAPPPNDHPQATRRSTASTTAKLTANTQTPPPPPP
jgi:acyl-CoA synthetase (AMP-forming)/AMP-acid ligase II